MRGSPRKVYSFQEDGVRNLDENFLEIWRNAQAEDIEVLSAAPTASALKEGQIKLGSGGKLYARIDGDVYEFTGVKL